MLVFFQNQVNATLRQRTLQTIVMTSMAKSLLRGAHTFFL